MTTLLACTSLPLLCAHDHSQILRIPPCLRPKALLSSMCITRLSYSRCSLTNTMRLVRSLLPPRASPLIALIQPEKACSQGFLDQRLCKLRYLLFRHWIFHYCLAIFLAPRLSPNILFIRNFFVTVFICLIFFVSVKALPFGV